MRIFEMIAGRKMPSIFVNKLCGDQSENLHLDICHLRELLRPLAST